jgi:cysteine desulfurase
LSSARHYFDWAATALPEFFPPYSDEPGVPFGNPSSPHLEGRLAREALEKARLRCAAVLGVGAKKLYFTSGGTEANALVIHSLGMRKSSGSFLCSGAEHPSVRENCAALEGQGRRTGLIGLEEDGRVSPETLDKALDKQGDARFAAIMAVNNETGAIMDLAALSARLRSRPGPPIHLHSDLVQAAGKIPLDISGWDLDSASISAHKLGGPRGIGLLYLKKPLEPLYAGGGQEGGVRPGTENVAGALALAAALEAHAAPALLEEGREKARARWKRLIRGLKDLGRSTLIPAGRGEDDRRFSPWILQAAFGGVPGEVMVRALDQAGFAVSTGSACSSRSPDRPVLAAMGLPDHLALEGIRISQGWTTGEEEIDLLLEALREVLKFL